MRFLLITLLAAAIQQAPGNQNGSIEGMVTRLGFPLADARVTASSSTADPRTGTEYSAETLTDSTGRFRFPDLAAGRYAVAVSKEGYLFGYSIPTGLNSTHTFSVTLAPGQRAQVASLPAVSASTIRGQVLDKEDRGIPDMTVEILLVTPDGRGGQALKPAPGLAIRTNDRGEYQQSGLAPGQYYIRTVLNRPGTLPTEIYYPETTDPAAAATVPLSDGDERTINIRIGDAIDAHTYGISGTVSPPVTGSTLASFAVTLRERKPTTIINASRSRTSADVDDHTGEFKFQGIRPGNYDLFASAIIEDKEYFSKLDIEVRDHALEKIEAVLKPGIDIRGRLVIEGDPKDLEFLRSAALYEAAGRNPDRSHAGDIQIGLTRQDGLYSDARIPPVIDDNGTSFSFPGLPEGGYSFSISIVADGQPPNPNIYVADIRAGRRSVFDDGLELGVDAADSVEIVVGTSGGSIAGNVAGKPSNQPFVLILAPESFRRNNGMLYRRSYFTPNAAGQFMLRGLAPGNYKIFAVPASNEVVPYLSPAFVADYEARALSVTVQKGTTTGGVQAPFLPLAK